LGALLVFPAALQGAAMLADELWFHRRRGLPRWERVGHPLDTLTAAACYGWLVLKSPADPDALATYVVLSALSCLFVTKDELVHARCCEARELWLHAVLFVLHPVVFLGFGLLWLSGELGWILRAQLLATLAFAVYQVVYWSVPWTRTQKLPARSTTISTPR
jgi:hypothetical protein